MNLKLFTMKKFLGVFCLLATVLTCLTACGAGAEKTYKDKLVGEWNYEGAYKGYTRAENIVGTIKFGDDGKFTTSLTLNEVTGNKDFGREKKESVEVNMSGDWSVNEEEKTVTLSYGSQVKVKGDSRLAIGIKADTQTLIHINTFEKDQFTSEGMAFSLFGGDVTFNRQ